MLSLQLCGRLCASVTPASFTWRAINHKSDCSYRLWRFKGFSLMPLNGLLFGHSTPGLDNNPDVR
ncbi:hypothetical protein BgiBS90_024712, partial [Biomphalaria glabrata]